MSGETRDEVVRKLRKLREQLDAGLPPADDRLSVGDFLDRWLLVNLPGSVGPSTLNNYDDTVRLHLRPGLGRKKLTKLTVRECDQLWQAKRAADYSSNSIRIMRTVLSKALGQAEREGLVPRNVAALSAPPRVSAKEGRTLTLDQAQMLLTALRGERREALVTIMLAYGLRRGEALSLHWDRLNWAEGTILVMHGVKRIKSHDNRPSARRTKLVISELKTRKSRRTLYLTPELIALLRPHRAVQAEQRAAAVEAWQDHGMVFPSEIGTPMDPDNFSHRFSALCKRVGLGHWHPHELRHSEASLMLAQGTELHVVSEVLGHTSIAITKDVYGHLLEAGQRSAAESMSRALFGGSGSQTGSPNPGGSQRGSHGDR
ncbi:site-specific integrase [Actinoplanes sp. TFC3]|uniref:tyrosine-type recombinase/integrase n=1 Tax=Actinoplanes sp. TFC3 TaxID=1710355 RepID=UPI00082D2FCE|nr:site-specific integrase [Actinoplanes sp. TFC3]